MSVRSLSVGVACAGLVSSAMRMTAVIAALALLPIAAFAADKNDEALVDDQGNFFGKGDGETGRKVASEWALTPLGGVGTLKNSSALKAKPAFRSSLPRYRKGPVLCGAGAACHVVFAEPPPQPSKHWRIHKAYATATNLANEVAIHLSKMTGVEVPVEWKDVSGPAVVLAREEGDDEHWSVKTEGNRVYLRGAGAGLGHAVTYFLEALGCRYLWPGVTGKVIPKRKTVPAPVIDFSARPQMLARCMRGGPKSPFPKTGYGATLGYDFMKSRGTDPEAWRVAFNAAYDPHPGAERDFYRWHGILDNDDSWVSHGAYTRSKVSEGHSYGGWGEKYGKDHPDWFALQPSGSRDPEKAGVVARPCFCYTNQGFIDEAVRTLLARHADTEKYGIVKEALTISPPDGAAAKPCMCERCRRLDPVNAKRIDFTYRDPVSNELIYTNYVSMTDRMYWYFNRVLKQLRETRPEKKVCVYAYAGFVEPPVSVQPDKGLVVFNVSGNYNNKKNWNWAKENVGAWLNLGPDIYWRPNAMWGWRPMGPQNFSRRLFEDLELFKQNGLKGTDFDCVHDSWSTRGLDYYMTARGHLNYDRLSYDAILDDYCRAGFGKAAPAMKRFFLAVEAMTDETAEVCSKDERPEYDYSNAFKSWHYLETFDPAKLKTLLTQARDAAGDDPEIQARIRFIAVGVKALDFEKRVAAEFKKLCPPEKYVIRVSSPELDDLRQQYCEFIQEVCLKEPLALNYTSSAWNAFNRAYSYRKPKK